jgi:uncharacterized protein
MTVVLDTNVFLVIFPKHSPYYPIYNAILNNKINLAVSTEVLLEYEEQFALRYGNTITTSLIEGLTEKSNIKLYSPSFRFNLIQADADDNKFVDCAITSNADYIVTNDKHFDILTKIDFPKIATITVQEFLKLI